MLSMWEMYVLAMVGNVSVRLYACEISIMPHFRVCQVLYSLSKRR